MSVLLNNRYRVLQTLGSGGCGETFLAEDTHMPSRRRCVIKRLKPAKNDPATYRIIQERFRREAVILEKLGGCDQIPPLYAYFTEAQEFYLVQGWIEGQNLMQLLKERGTFSESEVVSLLLNLLPVLAYVHSQRIIHRDIKHENIMLRASDGKPVLIDFGAVKEVVAGVADAQVATPANSIVIGSPGFMPVEQVAGTPVFASDIYSLGLTAICLLTGKRPRDLSDLSTGKVHWRKYVANVSDELAAILEKAINPFAHARYQTAWEMLESLQSIDAISDLTILRKPTPSTGAQYRTSALSTAANEIPQDGSLLRSERDNGSSRLAYTTVLILVVLVAAATALFYVRRNPDSHDYSASETGASGSNAEAGALTQTGHFEIIQTSDGYTSVRAAPTTQSAELGRLYPGTRITCLSTVKGERVKKTDDWRYCPSVGGYIYSNLLTQMQMQ